MGRRIYNNSTRTESPDNSTAMTQKRGIKPWLIAVFALGVIVLVVGIILLCVGNSENDTVDENKVTYDDAISVATNFVDAMDEQSTDTLFKFVYPDIKETGIIADSMGLSDIRTLESRYDIEMSEIMSSDPVVLEDMSILETGFETVYDKQISIDEAVVVPLASTITYTIDEKEYKTALDFDIVCMKVKSEWYVYTGDYSGLSDIIAITLTPEYSMGSVDMQTKPSTEQSQPITKPVEDILVYDGVVEDLKSGKLSIDGADLLMPIVYSDVFSVFDIDRDNIDDEHKLLMPKSVYKNVPVVYVNDKYSKNSVIIDIANVNDISQSIMDKDSVFKVSSLYLCRMDNGEDYPLVYLPGNITFNSTYDDVKSLYGSIDVCQNYDAVVRHNKCMSIYQIQLDNPRNYLYLQFDIDGKLVAMQYYCQDLS